MAQALARTELGWEAWRRFRIEADLSPRPLRLLARPEPIEDVFAVVPDGPPVRFRWRRALHEVVASKGPSASKAPGGARTAAQRATISASRTKRGLRFWLFRAGLYRDKAAPRWFLHGMYA